MGDTTAIGWTDHTHNPWWGCVNVSPACDNCYAEAFAKRTGHDVWGKTSGRRFLSDANWAKPLKWDRESARDAATGEGLGRRHRVFCASMADVFEANPVLDGERARLWRLIEETPNLDWQLLTKRPEQVTRMVPPHWLERWPRHVWLGTTVEDQHYAELRLPRLLAVPGVTVRFLSIEPLLGEVDLWDWVGLYRGALLGSIGWVIVGGESGPHHRPMDLDSARQLRDQCLKAHVPFFFKQVGGRTPTAGGDELDGQTFKQFPAA